MIAAILVAMGLIFGLSGLTDTDASGTAQGTDDPEALKGGDGGDTVDGGGGSDLLAGFGGDDILSGAAGNDWLFGMDGADTLIGGPGNDVISGGAGSDVIDAGAGDDFVETAGLLDEEALVASLQTAKGFGDIAFLYDFDAALGSGDRVSLGGGDDTIVAGGGDTITAGAGADEIALGDWASGQPPVVITDFNPDEDVIAYAHDRALPAPTFSTLVNPVTGDAELRADGQVFALIQNAGPDFQPVQIIRRSYAA